MNFLETQKLLNNCDPVKIWVSSDFHFNHVNIVNGISNWSDKSGCRDFSSLEEMNEVIISSLNNHVMKDDVLIHLGDFSFGHKDNLNKFRKMINCDTVIATIGNHDNHMRENVNLHNIFNYCNDYLEFRVNNTLICCSHYPIREWNEKSYGSICLHGHLHTKINLFNYGKTIDVGLDSNNYKPYNLSSIIHIMKNIN